MKNKSLLRYIGISLAAGAALACAAARASAQDYIINTFDSDAEPLWSRWWGSAMQNYEFDPTMDAANDPNSGSMKVTVDFDLAAYGGDNQFAAQRNFENGELLDGSDYTNLVFDLHWDAASPVNASGNFGTLEYGLTPEDYSQITLGSLAVPTSATNGWTHVVAPIDPATPKLNSIRGVWIKIWSGGTGGLTGQTIFWVDNVKLIGMTNQVVIQPTLSIAKASPGLQIAASAGGQQYQRQMIATRATDADGNANFYSWVGSPDPVTYSMNLKQFPDAAHSGFQAHLFIAPDTAMPFGAGDTSIDWNVPHIIFFQVVNNEDGTGTGFFRFKTNQPSGNSMIFNTSPTNGPVGTLAALTNATPLGEWKFTFQNNTDITMTAPSGTSTNFSLPSDVADLFADPVTVYYGIQPNQVSNIGQIAQFGEVEISGTTTPLEDRFTGEMLDMARWQVVAADAGGVVQVPTNARWWVKWSLPANGFNLQTSTNVTGPWVDAGLTNSVQFGGQRMVLLNSTNLPSPDLGFFRLQRSE